MATPTEEPPAAGPPTVDRTGGLRKALHRLTADNRELEAVDLLDQAVARGATPIAACADRQEVSVSGTLRSVVLRPHGGAPALEAELYDGSATVGLVWLGRRTIAGIEPGARLTARGRLTVRDGTRTIFNPRYELEPSARSS